MFGQTFLLSFLALSTCATAQDLPQLKLPWGTWQATPYPKDPKIYLFKDVRFGDQPERFGAPSKPQSLSDELQNITKSTSCIQIDPNQMSNPPGGKNLLGDPEGADLSESEDCLFLDIYAPVSAFDPDAQQLPVVVWIYGGAYAFGSKNQADPLYTGQSLLKASDYKAIFIVGNYRVGAFGWLAGSYMQQAGQPNAGLYDQALLLEWVQDHVGKVNGDKNRVSAWGESAGAGSILHHLIRGDGSDPLFKTFVAQSPAFQWAWDNSPGGKLDRVYQKFSQDAGCGSDYDISCLRAANLDSLKEANRGLYNNIKQTGLFPVGPSVDGKWIKTIPTLEFSQLDLSSKIDSAIISHCANEQSVFLPDDMNTTAAFDRFLTDFLPGSTLAPQRDAIKQQYDCPTEPEKLKQCVGTIIRDVSFTCNTRDLFGALPTKSYMMQYAFPAPLLASHGTDIIPLFMNNREEAAQMLIKANISEFEANLYALGLHTRIRPRFQQYFASFALSGNPNDYPAEDHVVWPTGKEDGDTLSYVMDVRDAFWPFKPFNLIQDRQNTKSACDFWNGIAKGILSVTSAPHVEEGDLDTEVSPDIGEL